MSNLNFYNIKNYFFFFLKNLLTTWNSYFLLIFPLIFIIPLTVGPLELIYIGTFSGTLLVSTFYIYGKFKYSFDNNFKERLLNQKYNKMIGLFSFILFVNIFLFFWALGLIFCFLYLPNFFATNGFYFFWVLNSHIYFTVKNANWIIVFYYIFLFTLVTYSMCYLLSAITDKFKFFLLISFIYIVLSCFYGGVINVGFEIDKDSLFIEDKELYFYLESSNSVGPNFYISQFVPIYGINQFCFYMFLSVTFTFANHNFFAYLKYFNFDSWRWIILIISPYFWFLVYLFFGKVLKYYKKDYE